MLPEAGGPIYRGILKLLTPDKVNCFILAHTWRGRQMLFKKQIKCRTYFKFFILKLDTRWKNRRDSSMEVHAGRVLKKEDELVKWNPWKKLFMRASSARNGYACPFWSVWNIHVKRFRLLFSSRKSIPAAPDEKLEDRTRLLHSTKNHAHPVTQAQKKTGSGRNDNKQRSIICRLPHMTTAVLSSFMTWEMWNTLFQGTIGRFSSAVISSALRARPFWNINNESTDRWMFPFGRPASVLSRRHVQILAVKLKHRKWHHSFAQRAIEKQVDQIQSRQPKVWNGIRKNFDTKVKIPGSK